MQAGLRRLPDLGVHHLAALGGLGVDEEEVRRVRLAVNDDLRQAAARVGPHRRRHAGHGGAVRAGPGRAGRGAGRRRPARRGGGTNDRLFLLRFLVVRHSGSVIPVSVRSTNSRMTSSCPRRRRRPRRRLRRLPRPSAVGSAGRLRPRRPRPASSGTGASRSGSVSGAAAFRRPAAPPPAPPGRGGPLPGGLRVRDRGAAMTSCSGGGAPRSNGSGERAWASAPRQACLPPALPGPPARVLRRPPARASPSPPSGGGPASGGRASRRRLRRPAARPRPPAQARPAVARAAGRARALPRAAPCTAPVAPRAGPVGASSAAALAPSAPPRGASALPARGRPRRRRLRRVRAGGGRVGAR